MNQAVIDLCYARLPAEEGVRKFAYNDATGKQVTCQPGGNLSIGIGINLENGLQPNEIEWLTRNRLAGFDADLSAFYWYGSLNDARKSAFLDVAFNEGVHSLLGFIKCLAATAASDWTTAAAELMDSKPGHDPHLHDRYQNLANIILNGS